MPETTHPSVRQMSAVEKSEAQIRIAMKDPEHLKRWLEESGRRWVVFAAKDLVDALPWPEGINAFVQIVQAYRDHRAAQPSGRKAKVWDEHAHAMVEVPEMKGELLEVEELDRAIRFLISQITAKEPSWKLEDPPI